MTLIEIVEGLEDVEVAGLAFLALHVEPAPEGGLAVVRRCPDSEEATVIGHVVGNNLGLWPAIEPAPGLVWEPGFLVALAVLLANFDASAGLGVTVQ